MPLSKGRKSSTAEAMPPLAASPLDRLAVVTLRMSAKTMSDIRSLTTEAFEPPEREAYLNALASFHGSGLFEMSTCNRVVYAGLCDDVSELKSAVEQASGVSLDTYSGFSGKEAWEHLVMVASGLDAFVLGELQVLGQVRTAIEHHRQSMHANPELLQHLEHVVWASRLVRKHLGFTKTTASMLNLATMSLDAMVDDGGLTGCVVLGSGDMGRKAVEALQERKVPVTVVSRRPERARDRFGEDGQDVAFIDFETWTNHPPTVPLVISTLRVAQPFFGAARRLPSSAPLTLMDFSWPPSVDAEGLHANQNLQGMNHWIQQAHGLDATVNRPALLEDARAELNRLEGLLDARLTAAAQADFRSFVHHTLAGLAKQWSASPLNEPPQDAVLEAFGRELATWLCKMHGQFNLDEVRTRVHATARPIPDALLERIEDDLVRTIGDLHEHLPPSEVRP